MAEEFVYILHPDVKAVGGPVARSSFEAPGIGWKAKGWSVADPSDYQEITDDEGNSRVVLKRGRASATKKES